MMNYDLHSRIILRVPRFPVDKAEIGLAEMLQDPVFREAIYLASDSLYRELEKNDFDLSACSKKVRHTLAKYLRRMCYRPTPFGTFAAVATVPIGGESTVILKNDSFRALVTEKHKIPDDNTSSSYRVNPFVYPYGDDFRVLTKTENGSGCTFSISEIFGSGLVKTLVSIRGSFSRDYLENLILQHGIKSSELNGYIDQLKELQVILPMHFERQNFPVALALENKLPGSSYDSYCSVEAEGSLPAGTEQQIRQGIHCLEKISSRQEPPALTAFKVRFGKLFDRRTVPLLQALDPELGIDYDGLSDNSSITGRGKASNVSWSAIHELLLSKWTTHKGSGIPELAILDSDLSSLNNTGKHYPPGMSVMFTSLGEKLLIKAAGGASSLNMIGRFTALNPAILEIAKELASEEIKRNPDILFAEIVHIDGPEVASVNRKATVYDYQIPFFEEPDVSDNSVIDLNDLYLSLADNQLVLWSARLNKRIIPRFSNAYNYHRSTLPVFRFLCDLQHEGLDSNLNFSMAGLFPGLPFYPRVVYKDVVLEAASWRLDAKDLSKAAGEDLATQFSCFTEFACRINLPEEFYYEVHDHLLHINRSCAEDVALLLQTIPASGKVVLREYFKSQEAIVKDEQGNEYTHECIAFLTNKEITYPDVTRLPIPMHEEKSKLLPFDEWLYFKIYLHPAGYPGLLLNYIQPFIKENLTNGNIVSWFFISYYDDDFHLRVRVKQVAGREDRMLKSYIKLEQELRQLPNLKKLELSTYFKERERYAHIGIRAAEGQFKLSSEIVLSELAQPDLLSDPHKEKVFSGVRHLLMVCQVLDFSLPEIEELSKSFTGRLTKSEKIELDLEYREQQMELREFLMRYEGKTVLENNYLKALGIAFEYLQTDEKMRMVMDVNHMHLNRHYLIDQQVLEMKTYYFHGKIARSASASLRRGTINQS